MHRNSASELSFHDGVLNPFEEKEQKNSDLVRLELESSNNSIEGEKCFFYVLIIF